MNTKTDGISSGLVASIYLAFSDDGEHVRFWTNNRARAIFWSEENWETEAYVRLSDAEAIINDLQNLVIAENQRKQQLEQEVARLTRKPTIENAETTVEHLRAYAADNGYSHGDYADVMTEGANKIDQQAKRIKELEAALKYARMDADVWMRDAEGKLADRTEAYQTTSKQAAALRLAKAAISAINTEAKAFRSYENARNNFSDDTDERKAYERAMVKASKLTKQALAAIAALEGEAK